MQILETIYNCPKCKSIARKFSKNPDELIHETCIKIFEYLGKYPQEVNNHVSLFYVVCKQRGQANHKTDSRRRKRELVYHTDISEAETKNNDYCEQDVKNWLKESPESEEDEFYKGLIELSLHFKTKTDMIEALGMKRKQFYKHYSVAKQKLKNNLERL